MVRQREAHAFHTDRNERGEELTPSERERLIKPYLPMAPGKQPPQKQQHQSANGLQQNGSSSSNGSSHFHHKQRLRPALRHLLYSLIFTLIHAIFSVYVRLRRAYNAVADRILAVRYHHHRTPEIIKRDVRGLSKVPRHLSVILQLPDEGADKDRLETLLDDACEIAAWTASAGIPMLSIYERTGALKHSLPHLHRRVSRTLTSYFGSASPPKPSISLRAPHLPSYSPPSHSPDNVTMNGREDGLPGENGFRTPPPPSSTTTSPKTEIAEEAEEQEGSEEETRPHLTILLLDHTDGRQTLVDLTKTLAEMSQHNKLTASDVSAELIDAEISESVMQEPDLLVTFGERVVLDGYPPWQARLTEMMCMRDNATAEVGYHLFLRALYRYARAEFRVGR